MSERTLRTRVLPSVVTASPRIAPVAMTDSTVWQIAVLSDRKGEMQAFVISIVELMQREANTERARV